MSKYLTISSEKFARVRVYVWNVSVYLHARVRVCLFVCVRERNIWGARDGNNLARKVPRKKERGDLSAIAESMKNTSAKERMRNYA